MTTSAHYDAIGAGYAALWLCAEYVPEVAALDGAESAVVPVPNDCTDGFLLSFWAAPERVLDAEARRATSAFARLDDRVEARAVQRLADALDSGAWDRRHGSLRGLPEHDCGLRLVQAAL